MKLPDKVRDVLLNAGATAVAVPSALYLYRYFSRKWLVEFVITASIMFVYWKVALEALAWLVFRGSRDEREPDPPPPSTTGLLILLSVESVLLWWVGHGVREILVIDGLLVSAYGIRQFVRFLS